MTPSNLKSTEEWKYRSLLASDHTEQSVCWKLALLSIGTKKVRIDQSLLFFNNFSSPRCLCTSTVSRHRIPTFDC